MSKTDGHIFGEDSRCGNCQMQHRYYAELKSHLGNPNYDQEAVKETMKCQKAGGEKR